MCPWPNRMSDEKLRVNTTLLESMSPYQFNFARQNRRANKSHEIAFLGAVLVALTILISSCAVPVVQHPGSISAFDSAAYDTLITEQAAIEQAKVNIASFPNLKATLNRVIEQYNTTMNAYKLYHSAGSGDITALQSQIASLTTNVANLIKAMIPVAPKAP